MEALGSESTDYLGGGEGDERWTLSCLENRDGRVTVSTLIVITLICDVVFNPIKEVEGRRGE